MREATTAEEIFTTFSNDMLKNRLVAIYSNGSNGAPLQPDTSDKCVGKNLNPRKPQEAFNILTRIITSE